MWKNWYVNCKVNHFSIENIRDNLYLRFIIWYIPLQEFTLKSNEENLHQLFPQEIYHSFIPFDNNLSFIDQSPVDPTHVSTATTLPRPHLDKQNNSPKIIFASSEDFKLSASSLSQTSQRFSKSPDFRRNHFNQLSSVRYSLHTAQSSLSSNTSTESDSFNRRASREDENFLSKGIKRSTAFHTAELLEKQVSHW